METLPFILLGLSVVLFATSAYSRRVSPVPKALLILRGIVSVLILVLAAYYFYQRFAG